MIGFTNRALVLATITSLTLGASACGLKHVPDAVLDKLPYEAKIELLESENELALALDRLDESQAEVARARDQIRRAKDRARAAKNEVSNAADPASKEVAELAVKEAEMRLDWLRSKQHMNVEEEGLAAKNLVCAEAKYELVRLNAARKAKTEGQEKLDVAVFEKQSKDCDEQYAAQRERVKESTAAAEASRAEWEKARTALSKKTFDARASPYVE